MNEALGIIEIVGLATATLVADCMVKTSNVKLEKFEPAKGMGLMTVKVRGDVGAVNAAVSAGKDMAVSHGKYQASSVIARPSGELSKVFMPQAKQPKPVKKQESKRPANKEEDSQ